MVYSLRRILLVDDDPVSNFVTKRLLSKLDIAKEIIVCSNGYDAFSFLHNAKESQLPDLILFDLNMPGMNGFEFVELYKKSFPQYHNKISLMALTTSTNKEDLKELVNKNIIRLEKPLKMFNFYRALKRISLLLAKSTVGRSI
jgi:CheY-like chemotaxis protein